MLPKLIVPEYNVTLPLSGLKIKYRPFLVKEQKILLMALQGNEEKQMAEAMTQIMEACILNGKKISVGDLPLVDFEYLFLKIRTMSVGENVELRYKCLHKKDNGEECDNLVLIPLDLNTIELKVPDKDIRIIELNKNPLVGVKMKYPKYDAMAKFANIKKDVNFEASLAIIKELIESVYDSDNTYTKDQIDDTELNQFLEDLNTEQFNKILEYFDKLPVLKKDLSFNCNKCGYSEIIHLEGIQSFFG